jgi:2-oxo-3-hexenedioate decarboxylase
MTTWNEDSVATELLACEAERRDRIKFTDEWPDLDAATGYRIQDKTLRRRVARGEQVTGVKLGLTSKAKQKRMGLAMPLVAWLTDDMRLAEGDLLPYQKLIHPRVEPEIVFVMKERLAGSHVTAEQALAAAGSVHAGAEVIDSRYRDFKFLAGDVIADNASSGAYVVSEQACDPHQVDLINEPLELLVDGKLVDQATGAAVLGNPAEALALAVHDLATRGHAIEAGWTVLTGGLTDAVFATPGSTVECRFGTLGSISLTTPEA